MLDGFSYRQLVMPVLVLVLYDFGYIARSLAGQQEETSFDRGIKRFTWLMIRFILVMVPLVFVINGLTKHNWREAFFFSMAGYAIIAAVTFLVGVGFLVLINSLGSEPFTEPVTAMFFNTFFFWMIVLLIAPVITMRLFALEKASGTFETLMTTPVGDLQVVVKNSAGQIVSTLDLGKQAAGTIPVGWTPVDAAGNALPDGTYSISAVGTINGQPAQATTLSAATVLSVVMQTNGTPGLVLSNGSTVGLTGVAAIL